MEHILSAETMDKISDYLKKGPPKTEPARTEVQA